MSLRNTHETIGRIAKTAGSGSSVSSVFGTVYGGNSLPISYTGNTPNYGSVNNFCIPISGQYPNPQVVDFSQGQWSLPNGFKHGDDVANMDNPFCWVRLSKMSDNYGTSAWNADQSPGVNSGVLSTPAALTLCYSHIDTLNVVTVVFNQPLTSNDSVAAHWTTVNPSQTATTVTMGSSTDRLDITFSSSITPSSSLMNIPIAGGVASNGPCPSYTNQPIQVILAKYCYLLCYNGIGVQGFKQGDMVRILDKSVTITDSLGATKTVPLIEAVGGLNLPQRFINESSGLGGGGFAVAAPAPLNMARNYEIGLFG